MAEQSNRRSDFRKCVEIPAKGQACSAATPQVHRMGGTQGLHEARNVLRWLRRRTVVVVLRDAGDGGTSPYRSQSELVGSRYQ